MRRRLLSLFACVSLLLTALPGAPVARAQSDEPLGRVILRWTMTVQGSDTYSKKCNYKPAEGYAEETEEWADQLSVTYEGKWTWKVLRDDADVEHLEMDRGQGEYNVSGGGGGSRQYNFRGGPKADLCPAGRGLRDSYWVPRTSNESSSWASQAQKGDGGHAYTTLTRQGDEMYYEVNWDWAQEITLDGSMASSSTGCTSSSSGDKCGTSTFFPLCPGSGGAQAMAMMALGQGMQAWQEDKLLEGKVRPKDWGFSVSGRASYNPDPIVHNDTGGDCPSGQTMQGSAVLQYTLTYERKPTNLEAVLTIPFDEYEQWQPEGGRNEDTVGNQLRVEVELRYKDKPEETPLEKATFRFSLAGTSREPGVCLNAPAKDKVNPKNPYDLKIDQDSNPDLELDDIEGDQAASTKKTARGAGVTICSYDWGAYGRLKVTATIEGQDRVLFAHLDGHPEKEQITIPLDDNDNHIADAWEKNEGVFGQNLPANWDGSPYPPGKSVGDGISLYEKYRGFETGSGDKVHHERLEAMAKHIFIHDPSGIVMSTIADPRSRENSVLRVSQCHVVFVQGTQWTGPGPAGENKRIVNFNHSYGNAVEQHGIDVRLDVNVDDNARPTNPPDWEKEYEKATDKKPKNRSPDDAGVELPDPTAYSGPHSPEDTFCIVIYPYVADRYFTGSEAIQKYWASVVSHEVGHALGIKHHKPIDGGDKMCVMRYMSVDDPFPNQYCSACRGQMQVSDK